MSSQPDKTVKSDRQSWLASLFLLDIHKTLAGQAKKKAKKQTIIVRSSFWTK
jgi:hypothetical protein